ncbi:MAG: hypothetical protein QM740_21285 [Acidovorax sp.]
MNLSEVMSRYPYLFDEMSNVYVDWIRKDEYGHPGASRNALPEQAMPSFRRLVSTVWRKGLVDCVGRTELVRPLDMTMTVSELLNECYPSGQHSRSRVEGLCRTTLVKAHVPYLMVTAHGKLEADEFVLPKLISAEWSQLIKTFWVGEASDAITGALSAMIRDEIDRENSGTFTVAKSAQTRGAGLSEKYWRMSRNALEHCKPICTGCRTEQ